MAQSGHCAQPPDFPLLTQSRHIWKLRTRGEDCDHFSRLDFKLQLIISNHMKCSLIKIDCAQIG